MEEVDKPQRLYLIDASGYIFRAYYAIRPLSNSKGLPTNALFGFTSMLLKLLREEKPDRVGVVFDVARKTFRNEKYAEYKANRSETPADLIPQFPYFRKIVKALNLPVLELANYEADDVIGTIAKSFGRKIKERTDGGFRGSAVSPHESNWETVIVTGDKDLMQLVDDHILLFDSMKEKWIREPEVIQKFGVGPRQVTDILGLAGDASDNIPGVPGIGDKTATKLILEYGSLEGVLDHASQIKGKMGEKLLSFASQARLSKELATIVTDAPIQYDLEDFKLREPNPELIREIFEELGFKKFAEEFAPALKQEILQKESEALDEVRIGNYLLDPDKRSSFLHDWDVVKQSLQEENLWKLFEEIEMPLVSVLKKMESYGVKIDSKKLQRTSEEYAERLKKIEEEVYQSAGTEFNLNSPKQLSQVLFENMKLPVIRKTKTGYSTDVDVLTELAKKHEVPRLLLEYRSLSKLKSTYLDALPLLVHPETGRIHTSFHQTVAATGRLSSSNPNLQNIPIRTEEGRKIREAFVAEEGNLILSADYSQIELRILAHMSEDPALRDAFEQDLDIHRTTAAGIFNVSEEEVTDSMRSVGKTVNFAVLYGQGAYSLSQQLEIGVPEADRYIKSYYARFAQVASYKEKILKKAHQEKMVRTLFDRLRRFPEIDSPNANIRAMSERTAFNTVFQGTAADLIKIAMIRIQKRIEEEWPQARMLIQVHDELVFEIPQNNEVENFSAMVRQEMAGAGTLQVPLKVDLGIASNWYSSAH